MGYQKPHKYTDDELLAAEIADLKTDIRCAERDGLPEYAEKCRAKLAELHKKCQTIYDIEDGNVFSGTIEQFNDCFFTTQDPEEIAAWCRDQGWKLTTQQVPGSNPYPTLAENVALGYIDLLSN
jgi:hypothetical protein